MKDGKGRLGLCLRSTSPGLGRVVGLPLDIRHGEAQDAGEGYYGWPLPEGARFQLRRATAPPVHPRKSSPLERETGLYVCVHIYMYIYIYIMCAYMYVYIRLLSSIAFPLLFFLCSYLVLPFFSLFRVSKTLRDARYEMAIALPLPAPPPFLSPTLAFRTRQRPRKSTQLLTFQPLRHYYRCYYYTSRFFLAFDEPLSSLSLSIYLFFSSIFTRHFRSRESWVDFFEFEATKTR